jgi:hypothetical protein
MRQIHSSISGKSLSYRSTITLLIMDTVYLHAGSDVRWYLGLAGVYSLESTALASVPAHLRGYNQLWYGSFIHVPCLPNQMLQS